MNSKQLRILQRFAKGEAPRCSRADFMELCKTVPGVLQLESANGADTKAGYLLTALHDTKAAEFSVQEWLQVNESR